MHLPLHSVEQLLADSWQLFTHKFKKLALIYLINIPILIGFFVSVYFIFYELINRLSTGYTPSNTFVSLGICGVVLFLLLSLWINGAALSMIYNDIDTVRGALRSGFTLMPRLLGASILQALILMIGFVFLIVPGVLFYGWFIYAVPRVVRGDKIIDAFKHSRALVIGRWWAASLRVLIAVLLVSAFQFAFQFIMSIIKIAGGLNNFVIAIIVVVLTIIFWLFTLLVASPWTAAYKRVLLDNLEVTITP